MSDLTKPEKVEIARVDVKVLSKSNPAPGLLRLARVAVQQTPEIGELFKQARAEGHTAEWLKERLIPELEKCLGEDIAEEATYLADEYTQIGDSILLVSSETGRALARISEDDLYQPAPVPRESGNMVMPAKRLKPEIESFIVQWTFDQGRERDTVEALLDRLPPQTELLRVEGDSRLLMASRAGRRLLGAQIQKALPTILESINSGFTKGFFDFFPLGRPTEGGFDCLKDVKAFAETKHLLQDPLARNVRFDTRQSLLASSAVGWIRRFAWELLQVAKKEGRTKRSTSAEALKGRTSGLWLATSNTASHLRGKARFLPVAPIGLGTEIALYLTEPAGYLEVDPDGYWLGTKEAHDKWTVSAEMGGNLWIDWSKVYVAELTDIPETGISAEVV